MKILLLGEYSNVHWTLAEGLRARGHEVLVVSNGDFWKNYPRDIDVSRTPGKLGGAMLFLKILYLLPRLRGFDIVQLINPMFFELKAERLFSIYRYLKKHNRRVVLGALGMDTFWVKACVEKKFLEYSDFNFGPELRQDPIAIIERSDWIGTEKERLNTLIAQEADAIIAGIYENYKAYEFYFPKRLHFVPYPIHIPESTAAKMHRKVKVMIGINKTRSVYKGTDIMLRAAQKVYQQYADLMELQVVTNVPFAQYQQMVADCDILLDQLYSYTPAMNALMAMSKGVVVVGGGEEEHYALMNEPTLRPIANVKPTEESVSEVLTDLIMSPAKLLKMKTESIEYIKRHHDYLHVAALYEQIYKE